MMLSVHLLILILNSSQDVNLIQSILSETFNHDDPFQVSGEGYSLELCISDVEERSHELQFYELTLEETRIQNEKIQEVEMIQDKFEAQKRRREDDERTKEKQEAQGVKDYEKFLRDRELEEVRRFQRIKEHPSKVHKMISSRLSQLIKIIMKRVIRERLDDGYSLLLPLEG